jgi:CheY-like chemotaxis protein
MPKRILVVDDSPLIREVAKVALAGAGWETLTAESGEEGLAMAADSAPDAILLDMVMPGMDGPAVLAALREGPQTREIPVVFVTASAGAPETEQGGADGVIAKPFEVGALAGQVAEVLGWDA